jgi:hypothetical protein
VERTTQPYERPRIVARRNTAHATIVWRPSRGCVRRRRALVGGLASRQDCADEDRDQTEEEAEQPPKHRVAPFVGRDREGHSTAGKRADEECFLG